MSRILVTVVAVTLAACPGSTPKDRAVPTPPTASTDPAPPAPHAPPLTPEEQFYRKCTAGVTQARAMLGTLSASTGARTVENTVVPFNDLIMTLEDSWSLANLMFNVHPDKGIRDAAARCEQDASRLDSDLYLDRGVFDAFVALDTAGLDAETRRLVERTITRYRINGVDKDEATRARLREIDEQLTVLGQQFDEHIAADKRTLKFTPEQLVGLPQDFLDAHKPGADGLIALTTDTPDYMPVISYADNGDVRRELYVARKARAGATNDAVLEQILVLRAERARLLGFASWADYVTADKMMKSGTAAGEFIERVAKSAAKRAKQDYKQLLARKRKDKAHRKATAVEDHEKVYYDTKVKAEQYQLDPQEVRAYFEYNQVEQGLLAITSEIYGIEYVPLDPAEADVWHPSVKAYTVTQGGKPIGRIYLDMHPRPNKYGHQAMFSLRVGVGGKQLPWGALVCNFPDPASSDGPVLMEHGDVTTMFHEFGHLMHYTLGGHVRWARYSGTQVERDFVEAPSQMFEEWAWNHESLKRFARHHQTGEVIPEALVKKMRRADEFGIGLTVQQQMFYAAVSLEVHRADPATLDVDKLVRTLQARHTPFAYIEGTAMHANFGHLNGYSAMYYTYMWSLVLAKDIQSPFKQHGLMNLEWTHRYRDRVLAPGGTKDAADLMQDFLGRPYNFDAFEAWITG